MVSDNFFMIMMTIVAMIAITITVTITITNMITTTMIYLTAITIYPMKLIIFCVMHVYFLNDTVGSTDKMSSMTYLYFTSKHTHSLRKTNNNPIYDCDILYSNILGENSPLSEQDAYDL